MRTPMVWLADRACRWRCPCECHQGRVPAVRRPTRPHVPLPVPTGQLDLFATAGAP
jgi:hypothetical protein